LEYLKELETSGGRRNYVGDIMKTREFEELGVNVYKERTRAFIKIQEGCNQFCTYCIIPYARGPVRSRSEENILRKCQDLHTVGIKKWCLPEYMLHLMEKI